MSEGGAAVVAHSQERGGVDNTRAVFVYE